jgi:hypothetical protein
MRVLSGGEKVWRRIKTDNPGKSVSPLTWLRQAPLGGRSFLGRPGEQPSSKGPQ